MYININGGKMTMAAYGAAMYGAAAFLPPVIKFNVGKKLTSARN